MSILHPIRDWALVKLEKPEEKSKGGILLPSAEIEVRIGRVIAIGPGAVTLTGHLIPSVVTAGRRVLVEKHAPCVEIELGDKREKHLILRESSLMCTVSGEGGL